MPTISQMTTVTVIGQQLSKATQLLHDRAEPGLLGQFLLLLAQREVPPVLACVPPPLSTQETLQLLAASQLLELLSQGQLPLLS